MKLIILVGALAVLAGCRHHPKPPLDVSVPDPHIIVDGPPPLPRSIPRETAVARLPQPELAPAEINPEAEIQRPDLPRVITETNGRLLDVYFDYDRDELTSEALSAVQKDATLLAPILSDFPRLTVWIEGHCDERGSAEYNLALGDVRASRVADVLRRLGLASASLHTISYGKERPQCTEPGETCWQKNRRAHLVVRQADARE
jgi:peptidoglycan-associated lipoprotein